MRTHILGGGPAGLYFAILQKARHPEHEIRVFERNAPDDTFGFGVVFSNETLGNLAEADRPTYEAIARGFAHWDAIDVRYRGEVIRSVGHGFCGIKRASLLEILQTRAMELGVTLSFHTEVEDVESLRDCDLFVGADGVKSRTRARYEDAFRPTIDRRRSRYIWFGSHQSFEAFTFSFRENEHGLFQIHAYQFDEDMSTVIVECDEATALRARVEEQSGEEAIAYCEALFAEDLGGHALLANRSSWIRFPNITNERWHHDGVVLLGDAAHTAHFSIGSGTKLAMEDAIALSDSLSREPDVSRALALYEEERRPIVGRTQRAAQQSLEWFEEAPRHNGAPPMRFAFSLLTRSRRITHENLRLRDPEFIERADRFFLAHEGLGSPAAEEAVPPPMFTPFRLRELELVNRVVVSPMCQYSAVEGVPNDWHLMHLGARAVGGAGLVFTEMTNVSADARISPGCTGLWNEAQLEAWARIVRFVHAHSRAKIGLQLGHAGPKGSTKVMWEGMDEPLEEGGWPVIGPSPLPYAPGMQVPREMNEADMAAVRADFVRSTELAERAGFDLLEVHFAHGYLLSAFLTPLSNQRQDAYGGSLENRLRFPLEVLDAVRAAWPKHKPISVRISAVDWVEGGNTIEDAVEIARALAAHDVDLVDVSAGQTSPKAEPVYGRCFQTPFAERIRTEVGVPTLAVGNIPDADHINTILLAGRADLCALARPHLRDPHFTMAAAAELDFQGLYYPPQYRAGRPRPRREAR